MCIQYILNSILFQILYFLCHGEVSLMPSLLKCSSKTCPHFAQAENNERLISTIVLPLSKMLLLAINTAMFSDAKWLLYTIMLL